MNKSKIRITTLIYSAMLFSVACSSDKHEVNSINYCGYLIPSDSSNYEVRQAVDFATTVSTHDSLQYVIYCGRHPRLPQGLKFAVQDTFGPGLEIEQRHEINSIQFARRIEEISDESKKINQEIFDSEGPFGEFPDLIFDTLNLYHLNKQSYSIWFAIPWENGMADIVIHDSTLQSYEKDHVYNMEYIIGDLVCLHIQNVSLEDTLRIFDLVNKIEQNEESIIQTQ